MNDDTEMEVIQKWRHDWKELFCGEDRTIPDRTIRIAPTRFYSPRQGQFYFVSNIYQKRYSFTIGIDIFISISA